MIKTTSRYVWTLLWGALLLGSWAVVATAAPKGKAVFADSKGVAIRGYDPVAYFAQKKAIKGKAEHAHRYGGASWWFVSAKNKAAFVAHPERYMPQYGGFCAFAMAQGKRVPIDPKAWSLVKGKLYLNYSKGVQAKWEKERDALIKKADAHWSK